MAVTPSYTHLEDEVLHLPREQRSRLASLILESLDDDDFLPSPEWDAELTRRTRELDGEQAKTIPAREVWSRLNKEFGTNFRSVEVVYHDEALHEGLDVASMFSPHSLIYRIRGIDSIEVIAVMHPARKPGYWAKRIGR